MQTHSSLPQSRLQMFDNDKDDLSYMSNLSFSNMKGKRDQSSFSKKKSQPFLNFNQQNKVI